MKCPRAYIGTVVTLEGAPSGMQGYSRCRYGIPLPHPELVDDSRVRAGRGWYIEDAAVTVSTAPRTIHDFGGFPRELYQLQYPAPGDPNLAARVQKLLAPTPVRRDDSWVSTTAPGRFCSTSIRKPIFQWFSSALMRPNRLHFIMRLASVWRLCGKKVFSFWEAVTSCTTCMPMLGEAMYRSYTIGLCRLRIESASCF